MSRLARTVEINHFVFEHPKVDSRASGLVVAHMTDIHCGRWGNAANLRDMVETVNRLEVDLVVLTGDFVCYRASAIEQCSAALRRLRMPAVATLGNHDHWTDAAVIANSLASAGISVLLNASIPFESTRGHRIRVVGVDDPVTGHHDIARAFAGKDDALCLALCHAPRVAPDVGAAGAHAIFSGHTHGLQIDVPRLTQRVASRLGMSYVHGFYELPGAGLYVSRGLGTATVPLRFRAWPELALFRFAWGAVPRAKLVLQTRTRVARPARPRRLRRLRRKAG